jgi:trimeric autotransporter adhesin
MGIYTDAVQKLYVAYFNRPADVAGLTYWESVVTAAKGSTTAVSAAFATSAEYKAAYAGMDEYHVVAQVYQNLFGHSPDLAGLNFWGQALINKQMTIDNVVTQIAAGAQGTDATAYSNKVAAATAFTVALDTPEKVLAYSGDKANGVAKAYIAGVTDAASLASAIATAALAATVSDVVAAAPQAVGGTFTLTAGLDNLLGTAGNDVFNVLPINPTTGAAASNLGGFDFIDGSAGKDTLNIQIQAGNNSLTGLTAVSKNVETINITSDVAAGVDASLFAGATAINQIGVNGAVTNLAATTTAGFQAATADMTVGAAGASAAVSLTGVAEARALTVTGSKLASVTVSGTRVDTDASGSLATMTVNVTAGKDVQSFAVNTNQKTSVVLSESTTSTKHITTLDASASTGAVTFNGNTNVWNSTLATPAYEVKNTVLNVMTGSGADNVTVVAATAAATSTTAAVNSSISTGAGNDTITVSNVAGSTGLTTVDAGAGDDGITVTKIAGAGLSIMGGDGNDTVTLSGAMEVTDVIDGGAGTDTISMAGTAAARTADDYIVFNKLLKNFETLKLTGVEGSATTSLNAAKLAATFTTIDLGSGSYVTGVGSQSVIANGGLTVTASGYSAADAADGTYAGNVTVTEKATGTITANTDVLNLTVKAASTADVAATLAGDAQTANITVTNTVNSGATIDRLASVTINTGTADAGLASVTLSGNGSASVTNAAGSSLKVVDASALGGTLTVAGTVNAGLTYVSSNTAAETIKVGAGIDNITINASTYGKVDTITGLNLVAKSDLSGLTAGSDQLHVTGVATTVKVFTTAQTDLDLALKEAAVSSKGDDLVFVMNGDTYIYHDGGATGVVDSADIVVKLTGTPDIKAVILALGGTPA